MTVICRTKQLGIMTTLEQTFRVKETEKGTTFFVLEQHSTEFGGLIWVSFCEKDGKEMRGTRTSTRRLRKEDREFFKVK